MPQYLWYLMIGFIVAGVSALFFRKQNEEFFRDMFERRKQRLAKEGVYSEERYDDGRVVVYPKDVNNQDERLVAAELALSIGLHHFIMFVMNLLFWPIIIIKILLNIFIKFIDFLIKLCGYAIKWCDHMIELCERKETESAIKALLDQLSKLSRTGVDAATLDEWYWVEQEARCGIDRKVAQEKLEKFLEKMKTLQNSCLPAYGGKM
ncbi:MAG: hypothetical protein HYT27_04065 [Parcubacteria group bacterium]|nr:hypothetical protein [Parcubacteria group bacterium]